jgi:hypothetical protein
VLIDDTLRAALTELEDYLDGVEPERAAELTLPFASRWVLPELGLDLAHLQEEARTFAQATPLSDRILDSYQGHLAFWVQQRMGEPRPAAAEAILAERAQVVEREGFPRVAAGLRAATGDVLWAALARRIAESVL